MQRERHHVRFKGKDLDVLVETSLTQAVDNSAVVGEYRKKTVAVFHFLLKLDKGIVSVAIDKVEARQVNREELFLFLFSKEFANVFLELFSIESPYRVQGGRNQVKNSNFAIVL